MRLPVSGRARRAIVIGSGPNGLAAAITLAERGWDTTVYEAGDRLGGSVASAELTEPGVIHDVFSAVYPAAVASPVFARWPLARHGLAWVHPPIALAHPLPDGSAPALHRSPARTAATLEGDRPGDGAAWQRFAAGYLAHFGALRSVMLAGFPPVAGGARLLAALKLEGTLEFARLLLAPASGLADDLFTGPHARAWLYGSALHADVGPTGGGSAIAAAYLALLGHAVGWPSPRGGAGRLTDALVSLLHSLGGQTHTATPVARIHGQDGRVTGVGLADGTMLPAEVVVANTSAAGLTRLAAQILPSSELGKLRRFRRGPGTVKVDWSLDGPIPWTAPAARQAGTLHVGGWAEELARAVSEVDLGVWPERPFCLVGQQSVADRTRAPAGIHTAWGYTRVPVAAGQDPQTLGAAVATHVARIEAQVERFAPGFTRQIRARHVQGPAELEAANPNLTAGDVGGGSFSIDQVVFRPTPRLSPYRTGVAGLTLGSAAAFPGGAVHGVPGHAAALAAHHDRLLR